MIIQNELMTTVWVQIPVPTKGGFKSLPKAKKATAKKTKTVGNLKGNHTDTKLSFYKQ